LWISVVALVSIPLWVLPLMFGPGLLVLIGFGKLLVKKSKKKMDLR